MTTAFIKGADREWELDQLLVYQDTTNQFGQFWCRMAKDSDSDGPAGLRIVLRKGEHRGDLVVVQRDSHPDSDTNSVDVYVVMTGIGAEDKTTVQVRALF